MHILGLFYDIVSNGTALIYCKKAETVHFGQFFLLKTKIGKKITKLKIYFDQQK